MTDEQLLAAAVKGLQSMFESPATGQTMRAKLAAERERLQGMVSRTAAGESTYLAAGNLAFSEKWPPIDAHSLWSLITRGSDLAGGSVPAGYAARHPDLAGQIEHAVRAGAKAA